MKLRQEMLGNFATAEKLNLGVFLKQYNIHQCKCVVILIFYIGWKNIMDNRVICFSFSNRNETYSIFAIFDGLGSKIINFL